MGKLHIEITNGIGGQKGYEAQIEAAGSTKELLAAETLIVREITKRLMLAAPTNDDVEFLRLVSGSAMLNAINDARDEARKEIRQSAGGQT